MNKSINKIKDIFKRDIINESEINILCKVENFSFNLYNKDIMGSVIQEWFLNI